MRSTRFGLAVLILVGVATLSGAQDYRAYTNDQLRGVLSSRGGAFADIKAMNALSMRQDPAAVPLILGFELVLRALVFDIESTPRPARPRRRGTRPAP